MGLVAGAVAHPAATKAHGSILLSHTFDMAVGSHGIDWMPSARIEALGAPPATMLRATGVLAPARATSRH